MERKRIVVLSGAGISVESGIETIPGSVLVEKASLTAWRERPEEVLEFCNQLRSALKHKMPNSAHRLLADMERDFDMVILTQNVDDLHERAGSTNVIHLHGDITKVRPEDTFTQDDGFCEDDVIDIGYGEIHPGDTGGRNNAQLRPHLVLFGEPVPFMDKAEGEIESADILLVVGTKLQVSPTAGLCAYAPEECPIYVIDPVKPEIRVSGPIHFIEEEATVGIKIFAQAIGFESDD